MGLGGLGRSSARGARLVVAAGLVAQFACGPAELAPAAPPVITAEQYDCRATEAPVRRASPPRGCFTDFDCDADLVVGHRGVGGNFALYAPENGLSAIRLAILLGVDGVEIDVRHTADDRLVVMHDGSLSRTTGDERSVDEVDAAAVTALPLLAEGYPGDFSCARVPTFEEVLELARDRIFLVVDTKTRRGDLVARAIRDAGMLDGAAISVSNPDTAVAARAAVPEVVVQIRPDSTEEYEAAAAVFERPPEILEVPEPQLEAFEPIAASIRAKLFVNVFGRDVVAFGSGDLPQYTEPHAAGADVVQTEFPMWVLEAMGRKTWSGLSEHRDLGLDAPLLRR